MTRKVLGEMLSAHAQCKGDGEVYTPSDGAKVSVYVTIGETLLTINALRFALDAEFAVIESKEGSFIVAYEDLRALRVAKPDARLGYGTSD